LLKLMQRMRRVNVMKTVPRSNVSAVRLPLWREKAVEGPNGELLDPPTPEPLPAWRLPAGLVSNPDVDEAPFTD
jgi:hypothetical protein